MPCRITPSELSYLVALQLGDIEAEIRSRVEAEVRRIISEFANQCPPIEKLIPLINKLNRITSIINKFEARVKPFERMVKRLDPPLKAAKVLVNVLKSIPIPTTIGTPPGPQGGVIFSVPIKVTNKYSELLRLACELVVSIEDDIKACNALLGDTVFDIADLKGRINIVLPQIQKCTENGGLSSDQLEQIRNAVQGENRDGTAGDSEVSFRGVNGKNYKLSVVVDPNSPSIAPRRFAIAKDEIGVIVLKGPLSFASSTEVLIQELKFRIDNQLP